jgi:hypothetical protein
MTRVERVLLPWTRNSARNRKSEAKLRYAGKDIDTCSAGMDPGEVYPLGSRDMREAGVERAGLSRSTSQTIMEAAR